MNNHLNGIKEWINLSNDNDIFWMDIPSFEICLEYKESITIEDFDSMTLQEQKMFAEFVYYAEGGK